MSYSVLTGGGLGSLSADVAQTEAQLTVTVAAETEVGEETTDLQNSLLA